VIGHPPPPKKKPKKPNEKEEAKFVQQHILLSKKMGLTWGSSKGCDGPQ